MPVSWEHQFWMSTEGGIYIDFKKFVHKAVKTSPKDKKNPITAGPINTTSTEGGKKTTSINKKSST